MGKSESQEKRDQRRCKEAARKIRREMAESKEPYLLESQKKILDRLGRKHIKKAATLGETLADALWHEHLKMHPLLRLGCPWYRVYLVDPDSEVWRRVRSVLEPAPEDGFTEGVGKLPQGSVETTELEPKANDPWPRRYGAAWPGGDDEGSGGSR